MELDGGGKAVMILQGRIPEGEKRTEQGSIQDFRGGEFVFELHPTCFLPSPSFSLGVTVTHHADRRSRDEGRRW